ncbi:probable cytochrome P450 9f2 [Uranotaenia lowii]|uniref:probable cytochrome P450 9f2 n=1 Tax=Uranotaenia lowii TaxID=190385 RepID=UPI0024786D21|nr:probable cytochrome P450 9f2 [Uranotaenia lowii]
MDPLLLLAIAAAIFFGYRYIKAQYRYWEERGVPFVKPTFLLGNGTPVMFKKVDMLQHIQALYQKFPTAKFIGLFDFHKPVLMIRDPSLVKQVGVKDFDHFSDHTPLFTRADVEDIGGDSLFGNSLFMLRGQKWRDMRATLSPAFTSSKMRQMFELVSDCAKSAAEHFLNVARQGDKAEVEMKDVFTRFSNDVIASVAFGISVDSLREPTNDFYVNGKKLLNFQSALTLIKILLFRTVPKLMMWLKLDLTSADMNEYFKQMVINNMNHREKHGIVRNDMIDILMQVRKGKLQHSKEESKLQDAGFATVEESSVGKRASSRVWTENELISQSFLFFTAGFDTVSTCLTFLSYELMMNPDVQQKLFEEIQATEKSLGGKTPGYEEFNRLKYLDMVISETLRLWPPAPFTDRMCIKDYMLNDGSGAQLKLKPGQTVWFPITALHHDPIYYPNPYKFDPERFSEANKHQINPGAYLPFGIGPRACIGSRLALMEVKAIVYYLVKNFTLERTEKTRIPLQLKKSLVGMTVEGGMWIEFKPRA